MEAALKSVPQVSNRQLLAECLGDLKRRRRAVGTITTYQSVLVPFIDWCDAKPISTLEMRRSDVEMYLIHHATLFDAKWGRLPEPTTVRNVLVAINTFFRHLEAFEMIARSPAAYVEAPKAQRKPIEWLSDQECDLMWAALESPQERIIFPLLLETAMRQGEARGLRNADVDLDAATIRIRDAKTVAGIRVIGISDGLYPWIRRWKLWQAAHGLDAASAPFLVTRTGKAWSSVQVWETIKRIAKRAGVRLTTSAQDAGNCSAVTPHALRRTWATRRIAEGCDARAVAKWLGHAGGTATLERSYADFSDSQMRESLRW